MRAARGAVLATRGVGLCFQARRRRAEHDRNAQKLRAPHRDIAAVIAQLFALLVRRLVLFVDDDELEIGQGREHGAARAHDDIQSTASRQLPVLAAGAHAQVTVQRRDAAAEALAEDAQDLRGERYFWHKNQSLAAGFTRGLCGAQVDLGFAAGGHAVQREMAGSHWRLRRRRRL